MNADDKIDMIKKMIIFWGKVRKHCEKRRRCWLPFQKSVSRSLKVLSGKGLFRLMPNNSSYNDGTKKIIGRKLTNFKNVSNHISQREFKG